MADELRDTMTDPGVSLEVQVLAQIRDTLANLNKDTREIRDSVGDVRERVVRLEERDRRLTATEREVAQVRAEIELLKTDKLRRDSVIGAWTWFFKNWPGVLGFAAMIVVVVLAANDKINLPN